MISFGVAPAALAFAAGMRGGWDWVVLIYFVGWYFGSVELGLVLHPLVLMFALSGSLMISKTLRIPKL